MRQRFRRRSRCRGRQADRLPEQLLELEVGAGECVAASFGHRNQGSIAGHFEETGAGGARALEGRGPQTVEEVVVAPGGLGLEKPVRNAECFELREFGIREHRRRQAPDHHDAGVQKRLDPFRICDIDAHERRRRVGGSRGRRRQTGADRDSGTDRERDERRKQGTLNRHAVVTPGMSWRLGTDPR